MLARATVTVNLAKITENTRRTAAHLPGIDMVAVTKGVCGSPDVARAMLAGGAVALGDSRLENCARLHDDGIEAPVWLLRSPAPGLAEETVRLADVSLASEIAATEALDRAAERLGSRHSIVVMVDLGDLREGLMPAELPDFFERVAVLQHIDVLGIGTSLTCYGGVVPSEENLGELAAMARDGERRLGRSLIVSGGMSSSIELAVAGRMPEGVGNLRIGETILLGVSTVTREPILGLHTDAFMLAAPVIECKRKPSIPNGEIAQDAFGRRPVFDDRGERLRAICALGRQDAPPQGLRPTDERVQVLGASSDHLILDVEDLPDAPAVGEAITFTPDYSATLRLFTSPYVRKSFI